jgi:uncharacterized protein
MWRELPMEPESDDYGAALRQVLAADPLRLAALKAVQELSMPDAWIGAGFVRDAIWDWLHGSSPRAPRNDVDVIWYDESQPGETSDRVMEERLRHRMPGIDWSVSNQALMHHHNQDDPYRSSIDAMRWWPETATAVAVRMSNSGKIEIAAPYGLSDLFSLRLKPTPMFVEVRRRIFEERVHAKGWISRYPMLTVV